MENNIIVTSVTGRRHKVLGKKNEDSYIIYDDDNISILAIADGCSKSPCGTKAAEATLEGIKKFALSSDIWTMKDKHKKEKLLSDLDNTFFAYPYPYADLQATCLVVIINKCINQYIAIGIGDCSCAVITSSELDVKMLISPFNILGQKNKTVFANDSAASATMKIETGDMSNVAGFVLVTDGAETFLDKNNLNNIQQLASLCVLNRGQAQEVLDKVVHTISEKEVDDITIVMVMNSENEKTRHIAEAICTTHIVEDTHPMLEDSVEYANVESIEDTIVVDGITEDVEVENKDSGLSLTLLTFLCTPKTAEELILNGYCMPGEVCNYMYPLLKEGIVKYENSFFSVVNGG